MKSSLKTNTRIVTRNSLSPRQRPSFPSPQRRLIIAMASLSAVTSLHSLPISSLHIHGLQNAAPNRLVLSGTRPTLFRCKLNHAENETSESKKMSINRRSLNLVAAAFSLAPIINLVNPLPATAGILSGVPGIESPDAFSLESPNFVKEYREKQENKFKELDEKFKQSPILQELLKKSQENREKNRREIENKYCERGATWGVGDCALVGIPREEREIFLKALKEERERILGSPSLSSP